MLARYFIGFFHCKDLLLLEEWAGVFGEDFSCDLAYIIEICCEYLQLSSV